MQKDITSATEYKIGNTTYIVNVKFAPNCRKYFRRSASIDRA